MENKILIKARKFEEKELNKKYDMRPGFHVTAPIGWLNDPNGFSVYEGRYHLFFQYHPYATVWGSMHWGHCITEDFVKWEYLPAALAPDEVYDKDGCFSGSAITVEGRHILVYTGVESEIGDKGNKNTRQTQCIAVGDGVNYKKYSQNPVITPRIVSEDISEADFRDPKVWKYENLYYMVVGACDKNKYGRILLFSSSDLKEWEYKGVLARNDGFLGRMWECPDFFEIDDEYILIISPQDMRSKDLEFHNGNCSGYFKGSFDYKSCIFKHEALHMLDYGLDFYAPQTTISKDGRRILIAWMQSWDSRLIPEEYGWNGMMTFPRELKIKNDRLLQVPVREIEDYYADEIRYSNIMLTGKTMLEGINGRMLNLEVEIIEGAYKSFELRFAKNREYYAAYKYEPETGVFTFDRTNTDIRRDIVCERRMKLFNTTGKIKIRLVLDIYSAEIFVNDGENVMSSVFISPKEANEIEFIVDGQIKADIFKAKIKL